MYQSQYLGDTGSDGWDYGTKTRSPSEVGTESGGQVPVAAAMVAGQFLSNYLNQRAQEDENNKKRRQDAIENQGSQQQGAMSNLINAYKSALL